MGLAILPPATFDIGLDHTPEHPANRQVFPDGVWHIAGEAFWVNPRHLVADWALAMILPWRLWQGRGFGPGHLPEAGGSLDQAALMLDALVFMDRIEARLRPDAGINMHGMSKQELQ